MQTYALGIDLHKRKSTWKLVDTQRLVVWSRTVDCNYSSLLAAVSNLPTNTHNLKVALEPTCGWRWVSALLLKEGLDVRIANPYKLRLIADSTKKNDEEDAKTLAELVQLGYMPESWRAPDEIESWRSLVRTRTNFVHIRTRLKNQLESIVTSLGPLADFNTLEIKEICSLIKIHTESVKSLDSEIRRIAERNKTMKLLMTMPTVGPITAFSVLAEVGDFKRFNKAEKLASYAGLVPSERSSGESVRYGHITKQGSKLLRTTMIEAAIRFKPEYSKDLNDFLLRMKKTKGAMTARVALARKLLVVMWHMVNKDQPFVSSHDTVKSGDLVKSV